MFWMHHSSSSVSLAAADRDIITALPSLGRVAGKTKGLEVIDGMIFPQTLLACRWIRPQVILIEEVAGFMAIDIRVQS